MTESSASAQLAAMIAFHSITDTSDVTNAIRDALIFSESLDDYNWDEWIITDNEREMIETLIRRITTDPHERDGLTEIALSLSLCPLHLIDYAICFDDENDECDAIRTIHPSHDT